MQQQLHSHWCDKNKKFNSHHPATQLGVVSPCLQSLKHARTFSLLPPRLHSCYTCHCKRTTMLLLSHLPVHYLLYRLVGIVLAFYKTFKVLRPSGATDASPMLKFWCASGRFPCQPHLFMHVCNSVAHSLVSTSMTCRILFGVLHFVGGLVS